MFTGLVQALGTVTRVGSRGTGKELLIASPLEGLEVGESIACDGVCLTVERAESGAFQVAAGEETLGRTTMSEVFPGSHVHLERALRPMDRLGGHIVQGHVDGVGVIIRHNSRPGFIEIEVEVDKSLMRFFVEKGSVCIDGVSLTINGLGPRSFLVGIIPHTAEVTKLGRYAPGQRVNIEVDVLAKHVDRLLAWKTGGSS
ncbi:MAG: riboflavin synthase [Deltaproteobacteria bacterium]|nr:riboflavin synthase [Deltaproteobacteria bacterium]